MRISAGSFSPGHRTRAASSSPARHVNRDHRHGSDLDHSGGAPRGREFSSRREASGRYRDHSPSYVRGGAGARPNGRGLDGPEPGLRPFRSDGMNRNNNPNVRPREGDWFCPDPLCRNLNFARREYCNNCKRHRYAPLVSPPPPPRRDYPISTPPPRGLSGNPLDLSPGYRSPPRRWPRDHPPRHDHHPAWRDREREQERVRYPDDDYLSRRRPPLDWSQADRGRDLFLKPHHERRPMLSPPPPLPPPRGSRWGRDVRDRSRSPPMRGGPLPLPRDYRRDRGRDERRGPARARFGNAY
ncbi:PREDICTED: serine/arginine repetitive matrix protein 1 isoform X2 [Tarenaya hassleriana]|uniref:serine/arginine repetitive matrix protein 1 isoform X2 n=1 Tax=Tarenaya hassleriana TaxID=28532 RepID=UPI00053C90CC|nr:PREDICTED: serine/arginine repetitive matrix protein 1 isoform X2 [Tarenaya hassleriana]